jgi:hypothetical protein
LAKTGRIKMARKLALVAIAAFGVGITAPSSAGEVTGNGGITPISPLGIRVVAAAICAFSGLEDHPINPGDTQTPHESDGTIFPGGVARICAALNPGKTRE